ncbi:MAG: TMEM165/GDT1 family protein [Thermoplasmata archaeon]|nr:TMEM165/GDT1 family protein [Thermoplasmata archaeon]
MDAGVFYGFAVVFAVIGGLELVDRTSFSIMAIAAKQSPFLTWVGGALAFLVSTTIAVSIGAAFVAILGPSRLGLLRAGGGAFLIGYAVWLYFHEEDPELPPVRGHSAIAVAFVATVLLELGDTTMIFQTVFVATYGVLVVFVAGALALIAVAAFASFVGGRLGARVEPKLLKRIVVTVLLIVGSLTVVYGLYPAAFAGFG